MLLRKKNVCSLKTAILESLSVEFQTKKKLCESLVLYRLNYCLIEYNNKTCFIY